jgi:hypothetical protein
MIGWVLSLLVPLVLVAVGVAALIAPRTSSSQYGIVMDDSRALALIRAMGVRDVVIGILLALLALEQSREVLAWAMFAAALVAVVDFAVVTADRRSAAVPGVTRGGLDRSCWLHAAGGIGLVVTGVVLRAGL